MLLREGCKTGERGSNKTGNELISVMLAGVSKDYMLVHLL